MRFRDALEIGSTVIIAGVAVIMAYAYFRGRDVRDQDEDQVIADWEVENQHGIRTGPKDAAIVIPEFMDFQCPFCARLVPAVDSILAEFPEQVAVVFHHFPLSTHEYAIPAAIAAECAYRQRHFWSMYRVIFSRQKALGTEPWESFAKLAGIPDVPAFSACAKLPADSFPGIRYGRSLGERTGVTGTPTTWINGRVSRLNVQRIRSFVEQQGEDVSGTGRR